MGRYVSKDQYIQACKTDLAAWLLYNHPDKVKKQYGSILLLANPHVSVKTGYSGYTNWRTGETGNSVDYLMQFLSYTYPDAVLALISNTMPEVSSTGNTPFTDVKSSYRSEDGPDKQWGSENSLALTPPSPAPDNRRVYAFLTKHRMIPADVVLTLIRMNLLYQSETGSNAVFINPERSYYETRGTNTYADARCRKRGSCKKYICGDYQWCTAMNSCPEYKVDPFHGGSKEQGAQFWYFKPGTCSSETVFICESAIDAISLYVLQRLTDPAASLKSVFTSIGGAGKQQKINRIKHHHSHAVIATDNDEAGDLCRSRNPELSTIKPIYKDWNEDLKRSIK